MKFQMYILLPLLLSFCGKIVDTELKCLQQKPPSMVPEIFALGFISKTDEYEFGSVFNEDATEFFYGAAVNGKEEIRYTKLIRTYWSKPKTIFWLSKDFFNSYRTCSY